MAMRIYNRRDIYVFHLPEFGNFANPILFVESSLPRPMVQTVERT